MESIRFPGLAAHRAKHRELAGKIEEFVARHKKGDATVYTQLLYFHAGLADQAHQAEDQEYAGWLSAHGVRS